MAAEAGRDPLAVPVTIWGAAEDPDRLHLAPIAQPRSRRAAGWAEPRETHRTTARDGFRFRSTHPTRLYMAPGHTHGEREDCQAAFLSSNSIRTFCGPRRKAIRTPDRKSTRLNSSHMS